MLLILHALTHNFSIIQWTIQSLFKQWPILELQICRYWLNIGLGQLNIGLIM